jgi:hypothetical protein
MKILPLFIFIIGNWSNASAFSVNRQTFMKQIATAACSTVAISTPQTSNAASVEKADGKIIRADKCAYGEGSGCESLAEENEFIKELQKRSLSKKEATQKEYLNAYQNKNYPDFFASLSTPKYMVKTGDGTFQLFDDAELLQLKKEGRITLERPTAMGGKVTDLTQKPIMVLR